MSGQVTVYAKVGGTLPGQACWTSTSGTGAAGWDAQTAKIHICRKRSPTWRSCTHKPASRLEVAYLDLDESFQNVTSTYGNGDLSALLAQSSGAPGARRKRLLRR